MAEIMKMLAWKWKDKGLSNILIRVFISVSTTACNTFLSTGHVKIEDDEPLRPALHLAFSVIFLSKT